MRPFFLITTIAVTTTLITSSLSVSSQTTPGIAAALTGQNTVARNTVVLPLTLPLRGKPTFAQLSFSFSDPQQPHRVSLFPIDLPSTQVLTGTPDRVGRAIALKDSWIDETGTLWLEFKSPVPAGTAITVIFKTQTPTARLPIGYGVAAYPTTAVTGSMFVDAGVLPTPR